jgi:hypothetical protein
LMDSEKYFSFLFFRLIFAMRDIQIFLYCCSIISVKSQRFRFVFVIFRHMPKPAGGKTPILNARDLFFRQKPFGIAEGSRVMQRER